MIGAPVFQSHHPSTGGVRQSRRQSHEPGTGKCLNSPERQSHHPGKPTQRNLGVEGCRILARQFRSRVEAHQARAAALAGASRACPFDLHALLPVPPAILQRGPRDLQALAWCRTHWGVTDRLRHVALRPGATAGRRLPRGHQVAGYGFFTDGETPHAAVAQLATRWTELRFVLQPRPAA